MPPISRRSALRSGGVALLAGLAGCAATTAFDPPVVDRLVFRADTGDREPVRILKTHAPRDGSTLQSHAVYDAPASGAEHLVELDEGPGFYNIHAEALNSGSIAFLAYNSHKKGAPSYDLQFEFVVKESGSLYSNIGRVGDEISIPGPGR